MSDRELQDSQNQSRLYKLAFALAIFTIVYNIAEGIAATLLGFEDGCLTLFGFGADSFIEVISGIGIAWMVYRIKNHSEGHRSHFEKNALRITGYAFYILVVALIFSSAYNLYSHHKPTATLWGIVISIISIFVMWATIIWKSKIGNALNSEAILADTECARVCIYMSVILLVSSAIYHWFHLPYIDSIGTLGLAYLSFKEGKECFEKADSDIYANCEH